MQSVTFLFTDLEGSTRLLRDLGDDYLRLLEEHLALLHDTVVRHDGAVFGTAGDAIFSAFERPAAAVATAIEAQRALASHPWPDGAEVRVRMGIHAGRAHVTDDGYAGMDVHRVARITDAGWGGQILVSRSAKERVEDDVPEEVTLLDLGEHRLRDLDEPEHLFQVAAPGLATTFPRLRSIVVGSSNLPTALTSFVGREADVAKAIDLLGETRLLTLTGPGGVGKTRLALEVGGALRGRFEDGVWLAELASLDDSSAVVNTVAKVLSVREEPDRDLAETLADAIRERDLLLVLDNSEHVIDAVAALADVLLRGSESVRILATSREPLGARGEVVYRLEPLGVPGPDVDLEALRASDAVSLFVARVRAADATLHLDESDLRLAAEICERLDGMPLAIELAAARARTLSLDDLLARLSDRLRLLTTGSRTALPHHRTLRAAIEWSHDPLAEPERIVFRRLAVFRGFALDSAEIVCGGDGVQAPDVLDIVQSLADKSLLAVDARGGRRRYRMLDTIRDFAEERLTESGEAADLRDRQAEFVVDLATAHADGRMKQPEWVQRLEEEHDNLRAAITWSIESGDVERALHLTSASWWFWYAHGHYSEGRRWLQRSLESATDADPALRGRALRAQAMLAFHQAAYDLMEQLVRESLRLSEEAKDEVGVASALHLIAPTFMYRQRLDEAETYLHKALAIWHRIAERGGVDQETTHGVSPTAGVADSADPERTRIALNMIAHAFGILGDIAYRRGDLETAEEQNAESLRRYRELDSSWGVGRGLNHLATIALHRGDLEPVAAWCEESLAIYEDLEDERAIAWTLLLRGQLEMRRGDLEAAARMFRRGLEISRDCGDRWGIAQRIEAMAEVARRRGDHARAARLAGSAIALRDQIDASLPPPAQSEFDDTVARTKEALGQDAFDAHVAAGVGLDLDEAVSEALAVAGSPADAQM